MKWSVASGLAGPQTKEADNGAVFFNRNAVATYSPGLPLRLPWEA
jgi:hypothetical protein